MNQNISKTIVELSDIDKAIDLAFSDSIVHPYWKSYEIVYNYVRNIEEKLSIMMNNNRITADEYIERKEKIHQIWQKMKIRNNNE